MVKCSENPNISVYRDFKAESENIYNVNNSICYEQNIYVKRLWKKPLFHINQDIFTLFLHNHDHLSL